MTSPPASAAQPRVPSPDELQSLVGRVIERTGAAMALADPEGWLTYVNPAFLALWGFRDAAEVLGRHAVDDFWMDSEQARNVVAELGAHGVWQGELMARTAAGSALPMRLTAQMLLDAEGKPQLMMGTFVDISAERAIRVQREAQRQFTECLLDGAGVLIMALDEDGRIIRFNSECERLSGWRTNEVLGRFPWETILPPEVAGVVRQEAFDAVMACAQGPGQVSRYTNEWVCRSGHRRLIEWTNRVLIDPERQGRVMISIGVDSTARRVADRARARVETQLRAAQVIAKLGSWELNCATGELEWSDETFRILELDPKRFIAPYAALMEAMHPDDREEVESTWTDSLISREPYRIEYRLRMADGRIKWIEERGETDRSADSMPSRSWGTVQDITERRTREVEGLRLRHLVEQAPMEIWLADEAFRVVYANSAAASSLGMSPDQLVGTHLMEIDADGEHSIG